MGIMSDIMLEEDEKEQAREERRANREQAALGIPKSERMDACIWDAYNRACEKND